MRKSYAACAVIFFVMFLFSFMVMPTESVGATKIVPVHNIATVLDQVQPGAISVPDAIPKGERVVPLFFDNLLMATNDKNDANRVPTPIPRLVASVQTIMRPNGDGYMTVMLSVMEETRCLTASVDKQAPALVLLA